jgi:hypothetical protein
VSSVNRDLVKGALVGAVVSSLVMISASATAGNGVGGVFNLGKTNTVNAKSTLTGATSGRNLQLTNTGSGPALGLAVGAGKAPIVVNASAGKAYKTTDTVANATHASTADNATSAANATHASNADNLGGAPASAYQRQCQTGAVMGRAEINGATASATDWTTAGVNAFTRFVCDSAFYGSNVLVKRITTGRFQVVFGDTNRSGTIGLGTGNGPLPQATSEVDGYTVAASGPFQCAITVPPYVICFDVYMRDSSNNPVNGSFTITIG